MQNSILLFVTFVWLMSFTVICFWIFKAVEIFKQVGFAF